MPSTFSAFLLLTLSFLARAVQIYEDVSQLPTFSYDFVVIGGGTAGNVVANRLTENPNFSVLVLEAGVSNAGVIPSMVPALVWELLPRTPYTWNFTTTPQSGMNNRVLDYPRGHMLGGSSSVNAMFYTRGSRDDFDRFADVTGDPDWAWDKMLPYFFKNERWAVPADHIDQYDPAVHSHTGINSVGLNQYAWPDSDARVIQTTKERPEEFPFVLDMNGGVPLGVGWLQSTINHGERSSSATSYLGSQYISRPNLHVLLHAQVSRVLQTAQNSLHFNNVEFSQDKQTLYNVTASKEIVLSAGSVGTPHILLNSGIGNKTTLASFGIPSVLDLPSVGLNFSDQPVTTVSWFVNSNDTIESYTQNTTRFNEVFAQWNKTRTGPLADTIGTHILWMRLDPESSIFENYSDPSAGPHTPHIESALNPALAITDPSAPTPMGHFFSSATAVVSPLSRGWIALNSSNPFDPPLIDPALYHSDFDVFAMGTAILKTKEFLSAPAWKDYIIRPVDALASALVSDAALDEYIRNTSISAQHCVGSAAMTAKSASWGVVDPNLRVKGATGLRIVDASVMPFVTSGHTQAPTYAVAERGSDLIKNDWK